jgi:hypothetical protein
MKLTDKQLEVKYGFIKVDSMVKYTQIAKEHGFNEEFCDYCGKPKPLKHIKYISGYVKFVNGGTTFHGLSACKPIGKYTWEGKEILDKGAFLQLKTSNKPLSYQMLYI